MTLIEHARDSRPKEPRPAFAQPRLILYVLLGGAVGTAGREGLSLALPANGGVPWSVLIVNVCGAFLLGFLLTALGKRTPETPGRRDLRLFAGTGLMGGFTTYSSLATDTAALLQPHPAVAIAYAVGTLLAGVAAAFAGVLLATAAIPDSTSKASGS